MGIVIKSISLHISKPTPNTAIGAIGVENRLYELIVHKNSNEFGIIESETTNSENILDTYKLEGGLAKQVEDYYSSPLDQLKVENVLTFLLFQKFLEVIDMLGLPPEIKEEILRLEDGQELFRFIQESFGGTDSGVY